MFLKAQLKGMILSQRELFCVIKQIDVKGFLLEKFVINFTFYILQVLWKTRVINTGNVCLFINTTKLGKFFLLL